MSDKVPVAVMLGAMRAHGQEERTYFYPNSDQDFTVKRYILRQANFEHFKPKGSAYTVLMPPSIPEGREVCNLELSVFGVQTRLAHRHYDDSRLLSILIAIAGDTALSPISITDQPGQRRRIENGFHRYLASIIAGFSNISAIARPEPVWEAPKAGVWKPKRRPGLISLHRRVGGGRWRGGSSPAATSPSSAFACLPLKSSGSKWCGKSDRCRGPSSRRWRSRSPTTSSAPPGFPSAREQNMRPGLTQPGASTA
jgi:hypothetical protein